MPVNKPYLIFMLICSTPLIVLLLHLDRCSTGSLFKSFSIAVSISFNDKPENCSRVDGYFQIFVVQIKDALDTAKQQNTLYKIVRLQ